MYSKMSSDVPDPLEYTARRSKYGESPARKASKGVPKTTTSLLYTTCGV